MRASVFPRAVLLCVSLFFSFSYPSTFTIMNDCPYTIWPGALAGSGTPQLPTTGFRLDAGQSVRISSVPGWSGRIWARTGCNFDVSGVGKCQTGDCGGRLECDGKGATPPASLFEITLGKGDDKDFYDVSIVDGYNLPMVAVPLGVNGACNATGCAANINLGCPKELQVVGGDGGEEGGVVACKSACEAFGLDQYCCAGEFANPTTCQPSFYSAIFKRACPRAYSYAFDDGTSTFTCKAYEYAIIFCPSTNSIKRPRGESVTPPTQNTAPPTQNTVPPFPNTAAPIQNTAPPTQNTVPPISNTAAPIQNTSPPTQNTAAPYQNIAPPIQNTAAPTQYTAAPYQNTAAPTQYTAPPTLGSGIGKVVEMASSSDILLPVPMSILLILNFIFV